MPQMAPLMCVNLMCMFLTVFVMIFCLVYFMNIPLPPADSTKIYKVMIKSWKW